ncbi:MAG: ABC transporter substrate-binding protein [Treponema sp.]|jgi:peptide/nickel transport system substrate-binding protein|nr:ABC transporter substrate-binding protein [Treponema sp.]
MKKVFLLTVVMLAALTMSLAAGGRRAASSAVKDTLVYGQNLAPRGEFHPTVNTSNFDREVVLLIFSRLVNLDASMNYVPDLAESYTFTPDAKTLTFKLKQGVKWTDGQPFTAEDVAFTYETLAHGKFVRGNAEFSTKLLGFQDYNTGKTAHVEGIKVIDPYTVSFTFQGPYRDALVEFADQGVFAKHIWEKVPVEGWLDAVDLLRHPVGTGPYKLTEFVPDQYVRLVANDDYFKGAPKIKNFVFKVSNPDTRQVEILNGELDIARVASWKPIDLKPYTDAGIAFAEIPQIMAYYLVYNTTHPLLSDVTIRKAIYTAIDRDACIAAMEPGHAVTSGAPMQPSQPVYPKDLNKYSYSVDAAKALFAQAGWTDSNGDGILDKGGQPLKLSLRYDNVDDTELAVLVQAQLKKAGIDLEIIGSDFNTVLSVLRSGTDPFELAFMGASYRPNPGSGGGLMWLSRYENAQERGLFNKALDSGTDAEAIANWGAWARFQNDQLPLPVIYIKAQGYAVNPRLVGYTPISIEWLPNVHTWYFK